LFVVDKPNPVPYTRDGKAIWHPRKTQKILAWGMDVFLPTMMLSRFAMLRAFFFPTLPKRVPHPIFSGG